MTKKEINQQHFLFFAEVLAQAGLFRFMEGRNAPLEIGGEGRYAAWPCLDTNEDRLREENRVRDEEEGIHPDESSPICSLEGQGREYYVALPRSADDDNIRSRARQLLDACLKAQ